MTGINHNSRNGRSLGMLPALLLGLFVVLISSGGPLKAQTLRDTLLVGSELDYPPYCIVTPEGEADGFSIDLFKAVASAVHLKVKFKVAPWSQLKEELVSGDIDALPVVGRTPERESLYDFTLPYLTMHGAIVIREGHQGIRGFNDLMGKTIALMQGDNAEEYLRRNNLGEHLLLLPSYEEALKQLSEGRAEAVVVQRLVAVELIARNGINNLHILNTQLPGFEQNFCMGVRKGNEKLVNLLNEGLAIVIADGTFSAIRQKWFTPASIMEFGKSRILVGGDSNYPPYEYLDPNGQPSGFNVDLITAMAQEMNLMIDIRLGPWTEMVKLLRNGDIDMLQGMYYSQERDSLFDFTSPHTLVAQAFVYRQGAPEPLHLGDLEGKTVAVENGDIMHEIVMRQGNPASVRAYQSQEEAVKSVVEGFSDVAIGGRTILNYLIEQNRWHHLEVSKQSLMLAEYCFAVKNGNQPLLNLLNEGLLNLEASGKYRLIHKQWLGIYEAPQTELKTILNYAVYILVPLLVLLALTLAWSRTLRARVRQKTVELQRANLQLERALVKAEESDRLKSAFLANMSHEIRTPMNGILGFAELLEDPQLDGEEQKRYIDIIQRSGERMLSLINDLVDISKIEAGQIQLVNTTFELNRMLDELYTFFLPESKRKGLTLELQKDPEAEGCHLTTDRTKLHQVLINLNKNAIKFTPGGSVTFGCTCRVHEIEFFVIDTGIGIPEEFQPRVFDRFSREDYEMIREFEGAGLGLSICKAYIEAMGGRIWLKSEEEKGSEFRFTVPVKEPVNIGVNEK